MSILHYLEESEESEVVAWRSSLKKVLSKDTGTHLRQALFL